jgi:succinoglycan biosynthesis transport protein ExoP
VSSSQASQHPEESTQGGLDLLALWRSVRKYWVTALAVTLAVAGGVTFYTLGQKRIYQASATVMFDPTPPRPLGGRVEQVVELGSGSVWDTSEYYETQYQVIRSHRIAYETVLKHGLHKDSAFLQNVREDDAPLEARSSRTSRPTS